MFATVTLLLAQLALLAALLIPGLLILDRLGGDSVLLDWIGEHAAWLVFAVASIAMAGSLFYSDGVGLTPCVLCWYQRIAMYPLVPIFGISAIRKDPAVRLHGAVLAGAGALIALYHYWLEWSPSESSGFCGGGPPCGIPYFRQWGFISIPYLSLTAFLLILTILHISRRRGPEVRES